MAGLLERLDRSTTVTLILCVCFGVMGALLLRGGALLLGGICLWACGMLCAIYLYNKRSSS